MMHAVKSIPSLSDYLASGSVVCRGSVRSNAFWETVVPSQRKPAADVCDALLSHDTSSSFYTALTSWAMRQRVKRCHTEPSYRTSMCCVCRSCWLEEEEAGSRTAEDCWEWKRWRINESCLDITALELSCFQLHWLVLVSCREPVQLHLTPAGQKHLSGSSVANTTTTLCSGRGRLPQKHGCVNSSGTLMLPITHSLVTQVVTGLEQRRCTAPRQRRSCWLVFLVTRETQKRLLSDADGAAVCRKHLHLWSSPHLYSQKVSSFMPCDSTSGWRSSFSFTAHEKK